MDVKTRRRLATLHVWLDSSPAGEWENAWTKINEILREHSCSWNDLPDLSVGATASAARPWSKRW
jgi:hypothetical protein